MDIIHPITHGDKQLLQLLFSHQYENAAARNVRFRATDVILNTKGRAAEIARRATK